MSRVTGDPGEFRKCSPLQTPWIGLYDDVNSWRWSMSESDFYRQDKKKFRNWASREPNNNYGRENCVEMRGDGRWNDEFCNRTRSSICLDVKGQHFICYKMIGCCNFPRLLNSINSLMLTLNFVIFDF